MATRKFSSSSIKSGTKSVKMSGSVTTSTAVSPKTVAVDFLVVGGGGGGGRGLGSSYYASSGGGGGGLRTSYGTSGRGASAESALSLTSGVVYQIVVGYGGDAGGVRGGSSSFHTIKSLGGGSGSPPNFGDYAPAAASSMNGGCGGGSGDTTGTGQSATGSGTASQGYDGGSSSGQGNSSGGGGAGSAGSGANGGNGVASTITGSSVTYAGGGGGNAGGNTPAPGSGGSGGGGAGNGTAGTNGLGGGGGGNWNNGNSTAQRGAKGGSGVVILRTLDVAVSTTGSPEISSDGAYTVYKYTGDGTIKWQGENKWHTLQNQMKTIM